MVTGANDELGLSEFDLPEVLEILRYEEKGNDARDRGEYDLAREYYAEAVRETEQYLNTIEEIRENQDLDPNQENNLEEMENRLNQFEKMVDNQINRL